MQSGILYSTHKIIHIKKPLKIPGAFAERAGLEPATLRLTAECSTIELPFSVFVMTKIKRITNITQSIILRNTVSYSICKEFRQIYDPAIKSGEIC